MQRQSFFTGLGILSALVSRGRSRKAVHSTLLMACAAVPLALAQTSEAATVYWDPSLTPATPSGGNGNWNQGGNWNNGHGNWNNGPGKWNGGNWQGPPKWKARKSCDPIVRWRLVGPPWNKRWDRVIVGYDCDWKRRHW